MAALTRPVDTAQLMRLLLADPRLPIGGHAVSGGLEPAAVGGLTAEEIPGFIGSRLRTVARVEAGTAVVARAAVARSAGAASDAPGAATDPPTGLDVAWAWAARTPMASVRAASVSQGRAASRVVTTLDPTGPAALWLAPVPPRLLGRALVVGALAGEHGVPAEDLARMTAYDDMQAVTSAALKLLPLDPLTPLTWVAACAGDLEALVGACAHLTDPARIPAPSAPVLDGWHDVHAHTPRRLFRA